MLSRFIKRGYRFKDDDEYKQCITRTACSSRKSYGDENFICIAYPDFQIDEISKLVIGTTIGTTSRFGVGYPYTPLNSIVLNFKI